MTEKNKKNSEKKTNAGARKRKSSVYSAKVNKSLKIKGKGKPYEERIKGLDKPYKERIKRNGKPYGEE